MRKRTFRLNNLDSFQKQLSDYLTIRKQQREQQGQDIIPYMETVYNYHLKGLSYREIAIAVKIPMSTVRYWIKKMEKAKQGKVTEQP